MLPTNWRAELIEVIRGAREPDLSWFKPNRTLDALGQIDVYREQFQMRIFDAILEELPGFESLAGDDRTDWIRRYMVAHPPSEWTLNRVAHAFVPWLKAEGAPRSWVEMAALDRAVMDGFEARNSPVLDPSALASATHFSLQPHVSLLRNSCSVHDFRSAVISEQPPSALEAGDFPLVVFRRGLKMRHRILSLEMWLLLSSLQRGMSLAEAVELRVDQGASVECLLSSLGPWFKIAAECDLLKVSSIE